jgi:hypothetical protein
MTAEITDYKNGKVIVLRKDKDSRWFAFGIPKAKLILDHIDDIKDFVKEHGEEHGKDMYGRDKE